MNNRKISVLELFAGIGACSKALENIGLNVDIVDAVEIDKYAIKSFNVIHGTNFETQDITKWDKDFQDIDLITHGSPCFIAGTKVITNKGYKNIEDLQIGDMVLTHTNSYKSVIDLGSDGKKDIYKLEAQGILPIYCTNNHPFYIRHKNRIWNNTLRKYEYSFSEPKKVKLCNLTKNNDYIGVPIIPDKENSTLDNETLYLLGRYVADGWFYDKPRKDRPSHTRYTCISVGNTKIQEFENHIKTYKYRTDARAGCTIYKFGVDFTDIIIKYGFDKGAINKNIPMTILQLPKKKLRIFLDGYMSGDGCRIKNTDIYQATTISRSLAESLVLAVQKVYNVGCKIYHTKRPKKCIIENRIVNQNDAYMIRYNLSSKYPLYLVEDNCVWYPIKKITDMKKRETIFNITVQDNHTYTANNCYVFNCQDFSLAGKQLGGNIGSGTRSSLMYETIRIVKKIKPKYVLWENVKNLLSSKHKHNFDAYIEMMNILGYNSYYQVLNAKDYGIPQNRERVYTVSIRKDIDKGDFKFPEKEELKIRLKDILEAEVDKKYYLSEKMQDYVLDFNNKQKGTAWEGRADEEKLNTDIAHAIGVRSAGGNQRAGVSNFVIDGYDEEIKVKDLKVKIKNATKKGYIEAIDGDGINLAYPNSKTRRGRVGKQIAQTLTANDNMAVLEAPYIVASRGRNPENPSSRIAGEHLEQRLEANTNGTTNCISTVQKDNYVVENNIKIRKLTPKECWRLMGFSDEDFIKAQLIPTSNTQLYKQAGNSIVVKVLEKIFLNLFKENLNDNR